MRLWSNRSVCRSAYVQLRSIGHMYIRQYLSSDATKSLVNCLVTLRLDNCNAMWNGIPNTLMHKLQRVQNTAARNHVTVTLLLFWSNYLVTIEIQRTVQKSDFHIQGIARAAPGTWLNCKYQAGHWDHKTHHH